MSQISITVNIKAPELVDAISLLASALAIGKNSQNPVFAEKAQELLTNVTPAPAPIAPAPAQIPTSAPAVAPVTQVEPVVPAAPVATIPVAAPTAPAPSPAPAAVPTATQTYTLDQLAVAATQLVDAGRRTELVNLLSAFGVQALTVLPKEQYGAFATKLREMGARI